MISRKWLDRAASLVGILLMVGAGWFLQHKLRELDWAEVQRRLTATPVDQLIAAVLLGVLGYLIILAYDLLGLRYVNSPIGARRAMLASYVSGAISNSVGLPIIGVGGGRFRFYIAWGMSEGRLARLIAYAGLGNWSGLLTLSGVLFLLHPPRIPPLEPSSELMMRTLGVLLLLTVASYLLFCGTRPTLRLFGWDLPLPSRPLLAGQFATGVLDWAAQALIFWSLLPDAPGLTLPVFGACFFAAMLLSMIGHVPAGLGVLDTGILLLLGRFVPEAELVGVLILFRLIYHVAPLALALLLLAGFEVAQRRGRGRRPTEPASKAET